MSFWEKLFGGSEASNVSLPAARDQAAEAVIAARYGLVLSGDRWLFKGNASDKFAKELANPEVCLQLLKRLQKEAQVNQACLVLGTPPLLIVRINDSPFCLTTALDPTGIADFVLALSQKIKPLVIKEYHGLWVVDLPNLSATSST